MEDARLLRLRRSAWRARDESAAALHAARSVWERERRRRGTRRSELAPAAASPALPGTPLASSKVCNLEDFADHRLGRLIREIYSDPAGRPATPDFPRGLEERKQWEVAMAVASLRQHGALGPGSLILGVGAGRELTAFWLTNFVRLVFATDLYLAPGDWQHTAPPRMLMCPEPPNPMHWRPTGLVAQHMDALDLRYDDATFDGVFSSSSIEHFGDHGDVRRSAQEMCRVLRPGGVLSLSTELRIAGKPPGLPGTLLFDWGQLEELIVRGLPWRLVGPPELELSPATLATQVSFEEAAADVRLGRPRWSTYPHLVLRQGAHAWTSVHLTLIKDTAG